MKIRINEDSNIKETQIDILCQQKNNQIEHIVEILQGMEQKITGSRDGRTYIIDLTKILYIETVDKKTFLYTDKNIYESQMKLYQLEERLEDLDFFRAGKSVIINFNQIDALKPDIDGRILVTMNNKEKLFVSRQYAVIIKRKLGVI